MWLHPPVKGQGNGLKGGTSCFNHDSSGKCLSGEIPASDSGLTDYKFFCFDGYADCVMVCIGRNSDSTQFYFFDKDWRMLRLNIRGRDAPDNFTLPKPKCIGEMFSVAEKLSKGCPFIRVDLYESSGCVYFGELTFYPQSGFDANLLPESDLHFGKLIQLPGLEEM